MTLPTSNIKFSQIQTEFGGTNPINLSEYYRGGVNVPVGTADGGTGLIATSGAITMGSFRSTTAVVAGPVSNFGGSMISNQAGGNAAISVAFKTDGTIATQFLPAGSTNGAAGDTWYEPTSAVAGNGYYLLATLTAGTAPTGTLDTWLPLSSSRTYFYALNSPGTVTGTILFQISNTAGGSILASGSYSFSATRT